MTSHLVPLTELLARIDVAAVCTSIGLSVGGATRADIHLFAYLSMMVHSQDGEPPSGWGYLFVGSARGLPFAEALEYAVDDMLHRGELEEGEDGLRVSQNFAPTYNSVAGGAVFAGRVSLIEEVCSLSVFRPLPTIGRAVRGEAQLKRSAEIGAVRLVDGEELQQSLMAMMIQVRNRLPERFPRMSPAMLWLDDWEKRVV